jgi:predicted transcriptional regulator
MSSITLPPDLEKWANTQVAQGASPSVEALVARAVRENKAHQDWIDEQVKDGLAGLEAGRFIDGDIVLAEIDAWLAELDEEIALQDEWRALKSA